MRDFFSALIQILILFLTIYFILRFLKGTRGEGIFKGVLFFAIIILVFVLFRGYEEYRVIAKIFEALLIPATIGLLIIFQPELRRGFIRLGENPLIRTFFRSESRIPKEIIKAVITLSRGRTGALITVERTVGLGSYIEAGISLNADITSDLICTIFQPGSPLHDGAIIIREDRIAAAGCLFPLTENPESSKRLGTRHRAAIGITEEGDPFSVVVSEETGMISVAIKGKLIRGLNQNMLEDFFAEHYPGLVKITARSKSV